MAAKRNEKFLGKEGLGGKPFFQKGLSSQLLPKVYFLGMGPGDPELLTVKAARIIAQADLVLYAGSLVPPASLAGARADARVVDSAPLTLEETHALLCETVRAGGAAARAHTGDPSLYGAVAEQIRLLEKDGIGYEIVPGVTSAAAAAAACRISFTAPEATQTLILTRLAGRTPVPESERLRELARHGASMAIYLSAADPEGVARELLEGGMAPDTPVAAVHRAGWPDERICRTTVADLAEAVRREGITRQTVFLVLPGLASEAVSRLYAKDFAHGFRNASND